MNVACVCAAATAAAVVLLQGLRLLDPSGVVLEQVCEGVRAYLTSREDTVRCIVASLTDDSSNELADVSKEIDQNTLL